MKPPTLSILRVARFLPIMTMVLFTLAIVPNTGCGKGIFPQVSGSATNTPTATVVGPTSTASSSGSPSPTATATPHGAAKQFTMLGSGTQTGSNVGTCSGVGCGSSARHCECVSFSGTLNSAVVGTSKWTAGVTINEDDCKGTGTTGGLCCNGDSVVNVTTGSGKTASTLTLSAIGPFCSDPATTADFSFESNFEIITSEGTGKFANSAGTGHLNLITNGTNSLLATEGQIQFGK